MPKMFNLLSNEVEEYVLRYIDERDLRAGDRLPAERELADELGITRVSLRNGLQTLIDRGAICTRQGSGSFVCPSKICRELTTYCFPFADRLLAQGRFKLRALDKAPASVAGLLDPGGVGEMRGACRTEFVIESAGNREIALTQNVQRTDSLTAHPQLFQAPRIPQGIVQTQSARVCTGFANDCVRLLRARDTDSFLLVSTDISFEGRPIAWSRSICVGTRVALMSSTSLPDLS